VAAFSFVPNAPLNHETVAFTDASTGGPTAWSWDFGDGKGSSWLQNPKYIYATAGSYTVKLTVDHGSGPQTVSHTVAVGSSTAALAAAFSYTVSTRTVSFTNASTGSPTTYAWDFGDGTTSTAQNPSHTYAADDYYTTTLTVTSAAGASTLAQTVIVNAAVATRTVGLMKNTSKAFDGYTLFAPKQLKGTYLINNQGQVVHSWSKSAWTPGQTVYLLENGNLLHTCASKTGTLSSGGGEGGRIELYDWDDNLLWSYDLNNDTQRQHHDAKMLPNGHVVLLAVEKKTYAECVAAGFDMTDARWGTISDPSTWYLLPEAILEIAPDYVTKSGGTIAWEWHVWDHLVQSRDASKANYYASGVSGHPELYAIGTGPQFWNHMNAIDYRADFDQIAVSVRNSSEVWILDHSTTTAQAAGHVGGTRGQGGDLLYRWGNPSAYGVAGATQRFFQQHDAEWIHADCPGAGDIMCFDNGVNRSSTNASAIEAFTPAVDASGTYLGNTPGASALPSTYSWTYWGDAADPLYSPNISGAQRLPNGNTIICSGGKGEFREVSDAGEVVWKYICPIQPGLPGGPITQGTIPTNDPTHADETLNSVFRVYKYPFTYSAFTGKTLTPGTYITK
jgi:PKD repeat protein